jgi:hypothetical protein
MIVGRQLAAEDICQEAALLVVVVVAQVTPVVSVTFAIKGLAHRQVPVALNDHQEKGTNGHVREVYLDHPYPLL